MAFYIVRPIRGAVTIINAALVTESHSKKFTNSQTVCLLCDTTECTFER